MYIVFFTDSDVCEETAVVSIAASQRQNQCLSGCHGFSLVPPVSSHTPKYILA